jgi:hypothetical protein
LKEINKLLDELTDENFFDKFKRITFLTENVFSIRQELKRSYSAEEIGNSGKKIDLLTKEIKLKFDNIISEKQKRSEEIKKKLSILQNQKKISNYK